MYGCDKTGKCQEVEKIADLVGACDEKYIEHRKRVNEAK